MSIKFNSLLLIIITLFFIGCSSFSNKMEQTSINRIEIEPLKPTEYEIMGDVTGVATQTWLLGINIKGENKIGKLSNSSNWVITKMNFAPLVLIGGGAVLAGLDDDLTYIGIGISVSGILSLFLTGGGTTEDYAIYQAIENSLGTDALISPRFEKSGVSFWPFYSSETVKVHAKAIRIKTKYEK